MMSIADLAAIMRLAAERDCRVLITGDHEQLAAVEGGGGMMMLARQMGYVQLAEPVRFAHEWERDASLRLRAGRRVVLARYDEQGRLRGGDPEEATELACRAFLADHLAGRDALLLARTGEQAREMSRRVRDDLIRYGIVQAGDQVSLRHGAAASCGDLIVARQNDRAHHRRAARPVADQPRRAPHRGRRRASGDGPPAARPRPERRGRPGRHRLSCRGPTFSLTAIWPMRPPRTPSRAAPSRSRTCWSTGSAPGNGCTSAMSRGRLANYAYCITGFPRLADARAGSRPARRAPPGPQADARARPARPGTSPRRPATGPGRTSRRPCTGIRRRCSPTWCSATAASCPRPRRCAPSCPTPTTSACWDRSGTTWPAPRRPRGSSGRCATILPPGDADARQRRPGVHLAVAVAARGRGRRAGRRRHAPRRDHGQPADRVPAPGTGHRLPGPPPAEGHRPAAARVLGRAGPGHGRPRSGPLHDRPGRGDGRPHPPHRRARRRGPPGLGHPRARRRSRRPGPAGRLAGTGRGARRLPGAVRLRRRRRRDRPRARQDLTGGPRRLARRVRRARPDRGHRLARAQ